MAGGLLSGAVSQAGLTVLRAVSGAALLSLIYATLPPQALGGWLLTPFLAKLGAEGTQRLRQRVVDELKTTFASHYTAELSLAETLQPDVIAAYNRKATGEKYLINPAKGL